MPIDLRQNTMPGGGPAPAPQPKPRKGGGGEPPKDDKALKALQKALDDANAERERVTTALDEQRERYEASLKEKSEAVKAAEDVISRLERELSEAKTAGKAPGDNTYDSLIAEREKVEAECKRLQAELEKAQREADKAKGELSNSLAEIEELKKRLDDAIMNGPSDHEVCNKRANELQAELENHREQHRAIGLERDRLQNELDELTAEIDASREENARNQASATRKIGDLELQIADLQSKVASAHGPNVAALEHELAKLRQEKAGLESELEAAKAAGKRFQSKSNDLQQKLDQEKAGNGSADRIQKLIQQVNGLQVSLGEKDREINDLQAKLATATAGDTTALQHQIAQLQQEKAGLEARVNSLNQQVRDLETEVSNLQSSQHPMLLELQRVFPEVLDFVEMKWKVEHEGRTKVASLDPGLSDEQRKAAVAQIQRETELRTRALMRQTKKQIGSSGVKPLVAVAGALFIAVLVGVLGYVIGAQGAQAPDATEAPAPAMSETTAVRAPDTPPPATTSEPQTVVGAPVEETPPPMPAVEEVCYPITQKIMALHHGLQLRDGKIFGAVTEGKKGHQRIVCDSARLPDESGWTDVSDCKSCGPKPGRYAVEQYLPAFTHQSDASCYTSPATFNEFQAWDANSLRFDCGDKKPPYNAQYDCMDMTGCFLVKPDPDATQCGICD